jgi:hypothetical protein
MEKVKSMDRLEILGRNVLEKFAGSTASGTEPPNPPSSSQPLGQNPTQPKNAYANSCGPLQSQPPQYAQEFDLNLNYDLFSDN